MSSHIATDTPARIITRENRKASEEAAKLIASSRDEAERIIKTAEEDAGRIRQEALNDGYETGKKQAITMILDAIRYREYLEQSAQSEMLVLCMTIVRKLVAVHQQDYPQWIADRIRHGLSMLKEQRAVTVRLNPDDWQLYQDRIMELAKGETLVSNVRFVPDESLNHGDCVFESPCGELDGRIVNTMEWLSEHLSDYVSEKHQKGASYAGESGFDRGSRDFIRIG